MSIQNDVLRSLDARKHVVLVLLDLSAAFDTINHEILLTELHRIGVHGDAHRWIESYLTDRTQCVSVNKDMVLYSAVSSLLDRSKRFTLSSPGRPVHPDTVLGFSWKHSSHAAIAHVMAFHRAVFWALSFSRCTALDFQMYSPSTGFVIMFMRTTPSYTLTSLEMILRSLSTEYAGALLT